MLFRTEGDCSVNQSSRREAGNCIQASRVLVLVTICSAFDDFSVKIKTAGFFHVTLNVVTVRSHCRSNAYVLQMLMMFKCLVRKDSQKCRVKTIRCNYCLDWVHNQHAYFFYLLPCNLLLK